MDSLSFPTVRSQHMFGKLIKHLLNVFVCVYACVYGSISMYVCMGTCVLAHAYIGRSSSGIFHSIFLSYFGDSLSLNFEPNNLTSFDPPASALPELSLQV